MGHDPLIIPGFHPVPCLQHSEALMVCIFVLETLKVWSLGAENPNKRVKIEANLHRYLVYLLFLGFHFVDGIVTPPKGTDSQRTGIHRIIVNAKPSAIWIWRLVLPALVFQHGSAWIWQFFGGARRRTALLDFRGAC